MTDQILRELAPRVLAAVARRYGRFDLAEDATQEALIAAAQQWPREGVPDTPYGWLHAVASRRLIDALRAEASRTRREQNAFAKEPPSDAEVPDEDDTLTLLFLCCHPVLSPASQLALLASYASEGRGVHGKRLDLGEAELVGMGQDCRRGERDAAFHRIGHGHPVAFAQHFLGKIKIPVLGHKVRGLPGFPAAKALEIGQG